MGGSLARISGVSSFSSSAHLLSGNLPRQQDRSIDVQHAPYTSLDPHNKASLYTGDTNFERGHK